MKKTDQEKAVVQAEYKRVIVVSRLIEEIDELSDHNGAEICDLMELINNARTALIDKPMTPSDAEHFQAIYDSQRIVMRKKLPTECGEYFHSRYRNGYVRIVVVAKYYVDRDEFIVVRHGNMTSDVRVERFGGYWAKVEQDHFEFEEDSGDGN